MKLPSLSQLLQTSMAAYYRFPFTLINAAIGTLASLFIANHQYHLQEDPLNNVVAATSLGIAFLTTIVVFGERRRWSFSAKLTAQIAGVLVLAAYAITLPLDIFAAPTEHAIRYTILLTAVHLLSAAAPFIGMTGPNAFWQYNKTLFIRILTAMLYSAVLFIGLAIALEALEHLFGMVIDSKRYFQLWILISGMFNTWFFLAGVPSNLEELEQVEEYPKGLKVFTQYILLPLVGVYLLILYAYMAKILFTWQLPQGWVSKLVLGFSITGILALLLVHPIRNLTENVWIRTASRWYYVILLPLDAMLLVGIWRRISDYGVTESRYIVLILGLWLTGVSLYFVLSKVKNIKFIPASLCIVAFCSSFGPWGAVSFSESNQMHRLSSLLERYHILENGIIHKHPEKVANDDYKRISSIVDYMCEMHGVRPMQSWFSENLDSISKGPGLSGYVVNSVRAKRIVEMMGLEYVSRWQTQAPQILQYMAEEHAGIHIEGYALLVRLPSSSSSGRDSQSTGLPGISVVSDASNLKVRIVSAADSGDSLLFDVRELAEQLKKEFNDEQYRSGISPEKMTLGEEGKKLRAKLILRRVQFQQPFQHSLQNQIEGDVIIGFR